MVMKIYYLGGLSFVKGFNPYELTLNNGFSNQFKYSPFFALITGELSQIPAHWQRLVFGMWQLVGAAVFSLGLSSWSRLSLRQPIVIYVVLTACAIDLLTSMFSCQINAFIIGLTLVALAAYREQKFLAAGALLVIAINLKVYPVVFFLVSP